MHYIKIGMMKEALQAIATGTKLEMTVPLTRELDSFRGISDPWIVIRMISEHGSFPLLQLFQNMGGMASSEREGIYKFCNDLSRFLDNAPYSLTAPQQKLINSREYLFQLGPHMIMDLYDYVEALGKESEITNLKGDAKLKKALFVILGEDVTNIQSQSERGYLVALNGRNCSRVMNICDHNESFKVISHYIKGVQKKFLVIFSATLTPLIIEHLAAARQLMAQLARYPGDSDGRHFLKQYSGTVGSNPRLTGTLDKGVFSFMKMLNTVSDNLSRLSAKELTSDAPTITPG